MAVAVDTKGTSKVPEELLEQAVSKAFDFRPGAIIERFQLRRPIYLQVSTYGHFGRDDLDLPWEKLDLKDTILRYV